MTPLPKKLTFYLDFISPYAWLAFAALPQALDGLDVQVDYKPVLFAALLKHHGQLGPAEIPGKRDWTYRQVQWLARQQGLELQLPASHPFNPLSLLRLALACDTSSTPARSVCERVFRHVWCSGQEASDPDRFTQLAQALQPQRDPSGAEVKQALQANTDEAIAVGLFGVPSMRVDDKVFWGQDALPMLRACLLGDTWFQEGPWQAASALPAGVQRRP
ncbi:MAG: 2-hydroxychromene-2-carboxylate isomerase [Pseudomonadota bacterium]